jgi:hypothetical protein
MQKQEGCCGGGDRKGDWPGSLVVELSEGGAENDDSGGEKRKIAQGQVSGGVCRLVGWRKRAMLPCVDEEAVEAARSREEDREREQGEAKVGTASHGGNEGGCGEEEAYGDLLWETVSAAAGVNEDEVAAKQAAEDEIEMDGLGFKVRKKSCEGDGGSEDAGEEEAAVAVVEVVARFEVSGA